MLLALEIAAVIVFGVFMPLLLLTDLWTELHKFSWSAFKAAVAREWAETKRLNRLNYEEFIKPFFRWLLPKRYAVPEDVEREFGLTKREAKAMLRIADRARRRA